MCGKIDEGTSMALTAPVVSQSRHVPIRWMYTSNCDRTIEICSRLVLKPTGTEEGNQILIQNEEGNSSHVQKQGKRRPGGEVEVAFSTRGRFHREKRFSFWHLMEVVRIKKRGGRAPTYGGIAMEGTVRGTSTDNLRELKNLNGIRYFSTGWYESKDKRIKKITSQRVKI